MAGAVVKRGPRQHFRDGHPTCWGNAMFAKAHFAHTRDHSGVTCPVQGLAEMKVSVARITGCAPSDRFLPHCGFPNPIFSDEIAAVPRVVPSAYGMARRLRRGRNDGGDVVSTGPTTLPALGDSARRPRRAVAETARRPDPVQAGPDSGRPGGGGDRAGDGPPDLHWRGCLRRHPGPVADGPLHRRQRPHPGPPGRADGRRGLPGHSAAAGRRVQPAGPPDAAAGGRVPRRARPDRRGADRPARAGWSPSTTTWQPWTAPARRCWTAGRWPSPRRCSATA